MPRWLRILLSTLLFAAFAPNTACSSDASGQPASTATSQPTNAATSTAAPATATPPSATATPPIWKTDPNYAGVGLYIVDAASGEATRIVDSPVQFAQWMEKSDTLMLRTSTSFSGQRQSGSIARVSPDGHGYSEFVQLNGGTAFSEDLIAYGTNEGIHIVETATLKEKTLLKVPGFSPVSWSPKGDALLAWTWSDDVDFWYVPLNNSDQRKLIAKGGGAAWFGDDIVYFNISGERMLFDTSSQQSSPFDDFPSSQGLPTLSPDGKSAVYTAASPDNGVYLASQGGGTKKILSRLALAEWSPDGDTIAMLTQGDSVILTLYSMGNDKIKEIDLGKIAAPDKAVLVVFFGWSPDGAKLWVAVGLGGGFS